MKAIISIIIALALSIQCCMAGQKDTEPQMSAPVVLGMLVLAVAATATIVVVKIYSTHSNDRGPATVVLEKSDDHVHWSPIATNSVVLDGTNPVHLFDENLMNGSSFYRARRI